MRPVPRVFVDTNTLVSGLVFGGKPGDLLELGLSGRLRLLLSPRVVFEARKVFAHKFRNRMPILEEFLLRGDYDLLPEPSEDEVERARCIVRDASDILILAGIFSSKPDFAISGYNDLLTDEVKAVVPMCRCAEYLSKL